MAAMSNSNQSGGFDPEQEAVLRNLARSGAPEANMYAYTEGYHGSQTNAMQSGQPLDLDAQTLLESLANFEHPPSNNDIPPSTGGDHFASLLEAAATAGGQESQGGYGEMRRSTRQSRQPGFGFPASPPRNEVSRPKSRSQDMQDGSFIRSNKRRKTDEASEDEDQLAREREIWGPSPPQDEVGEISTVESEYPSNTPVGPSDARAAGVHSAAALFRRPSSASKKYTRPPMSKLFTSLELSPEDFLHLQAAAKIYMLDPDHPERRDCVGNRGRSDTDMVKLKLFGCVKTFLEDEGWGERCFGDNAPGAATRKLKWPLMKNRVISLVTPLLRRMVTNERQRQYAVESRRSGNPKKRTHDHDNLSQTPPRHTSQSPGQNHSHETLNPNIDPKLDPYHYSIETPFSASQSPSKGDKPSEPPTMKDQDQSSASLDHQPATSVPVITTQTTDTELKFHINILHNNVRIRTLTSVSMSSCPGFSSLVQYVHNIIGDAEGLELKGIRVLSMAGLMEVRDDEKWAAILTEFGENEWLGMDVRVVVDMV